MTVARAIAMKVAGEQGQRGQWATATATATVWAMATATRLVGNKKGNEEDGKGNEEGNGNKVGR